MGSLDQGATVRQLDALFDLGAAGERTDRQLVDRFAAGHDPVAELAFAALVERHGPMVLRICRAVLRDGHDAEDAFQATFLVLVRRREDALGGRDSLGPWLGGVAYRTALAARSASARRRRLEARAARSGDQADHAAHPLGEEGAIIREEVDRLPERFRSAVALCLLDGQTIGEAAQTLGCPVGTLQSRLARGRQRLQGQLVRRGIVGDGATVLPLLPSVGLPEHLTRLTVCAATRVAAGATLLAGTGSAPVAALVRRVLMMMAFSNLKTGLIAAILVLGSLGVGGVVVARGWDESEATPAPLRPPGLIAAEAPIPAEAPVAAPSPVAAPAPVAPPAEIAVGVGQSVQKAIDDAPEGATIRLAAGEYPEAIKIAKPLTLQGAGWDKTVVGPTQRPRLTQRQRDEFFNQFEEASDTPKRQEILNKLMNQAVRPSLTVEGPGAIVVAGIRWRGVTPSDDPDHIRSEALVSIEYSGTTLRDCAVVGPYANGVVLQRDAAVAIERTLIAGFWGTGLVVSPTTRVRLSDSDIRNCYHRCVTINMVDDAIIQRCRISGSAWHGIRYDNCSPTIERCQIFGNARSGIYASGETKAKVSGNVFWRNEMDGMSTWFANADEVSGNTFVANKREGFGAIGGAKPALTRNVFLDHPVAIICAKTSAGRNGGETPTGAPSIRENVFFRNPQIIKDGLEDRPIPEGNETLDPHLSGPEADFRPLTKWDEAGAANPIPLASPFPIQPGEAAIIPDGETRDSNAWKKAAKPR